MIWYFLLCLHFIFEIVGVLSHLIFLKLVVFQKIMDFYCSISLGLISLSMILMLVTYFLESAVCLSIGSVFEDDQCAEIPIKKIILCIHRFAEAFSLAAQLFFTIERVLSIQFSKIQRTLFFKLFFLAGFVFENGFAISYVYTNVILGGYGLFWLVTFQLAVIANFPFIYYAKRISSSKYKANVTTYSLKRKHNLYNFYEIARSFLYSTAIYMFAQLTCFCILWGAAVTGVMYSVEFHRWFFVISLIWNANLAIFPWIVMLIHRSQRERLNRLWSQIFTKSKVSSKILGMNGKELVTTPTQFDYFNQLQRAWE
ncbi:Serpentine Receptor, class E (Epsilon) [Caenorhabditis elegans]|uniref:Serpentine Receptor, class E (Epsilon) n=1 Tax=Caenorhabditis elegans TaxID=6239 RepID=Q22117_CAEEL|nr:Serpentine Receptor, class E (Epsilon) [Caenorhabditis elegans]CAA98520.2 Serpentine Receptor, class E (Epsilon) [Caenorhabditis elegans]|eukprot:NP_505869.2 Uncharacterized protein CELE_T03F7.5 [Caenorhabditis elegans]